MSKCSDFPYLPAHFEPEEEILDQLSNRPGNQRCVVGRDELLLVVHEVPKPGIPEREPVLFWRKVSGRSANFSTAMPRSSTSTKT